MKTITLSLAEAKEMYNSNSIHLKQLALQHFSEADLDDNYTPPIDDKPHYNIKTDLPETYEGACRILGTVTRAGYMMSSCNMEHFKSKSGWADHVYVPFDYYLSHGYVHLSNILILMKSWWIVDNDWEPGKKGTKAYYIYVECSTSKIKYKELGNEYRTLCFSSKELCEKFIKLFSNLINESKIFL